MNVKLLEMNLKNFKGVTKNLNFQASNNVYGDNGTGKTTLVDAHYWLYTGKNSDYSTKFEPKPIDENGDCEHGLVTKVTEKLGIDGKTVELSKSWEEKWKTRGGEKEKLKGHESTYFINGIEKQKKEFESYVNKNIIDTELIPLLTDPLFFNSMHWQDMRENLLLLEGITNEEVLEANDYSIEPEIKKHGEDFQDKLKQEKKNIESQQGKIPTRIDENKENMKQQPEHSIDWYKNKIDEIDEQIANLSDTDENQKLKELKTKLSDLEVERLKVKSEIKDDISKEKDKIRGKLEGLKKDRSDLKGKENKIENKIKYLENEINENEKWMDKLGKQFDEIKNSEPKEQFVCPHCGETVYDYELDSDTEDFYEERARKLEKINQQGKKTKASIEEKQQELNELHDQRDEIVQEIDDLAELIADNRKVLDNYPELEEHGKYTEVCKKVDGLKKQIAKEKARDKVDSNQEQTRELKAKKQQYQQRIEDINFNIDLEEKNQQHSKKLKQLRAKLDEVQEKINEMDQFIKDKAMMLQKKVNSRFNIVQFRLFEEKLNGSIKNTCIAMVNGVPYNENLNTGNKINAGIDIIDKLQQYYNCRLPIIVDNSESVTDIYDIDTQIIKLIKPEIDGKEKKEYYQELKQRKYSN